MSSPSANPVDNLKRGSSPAKQLEHELPAPARSGKKARKSKRKPGPQPPQVLQQVVRECIVLQPGEDEPTMSDQTRQYVFRTRHCQSGKQHYRVANAHSVRHPCVLLCRVCNDNDACREIAKSEGKSRPIKRLSKQEQELLTHVDTWSIGGVPRQFVHEVKPFVSCGPDLCAVSVDVIIFGGRITANVADFKRGLLVFIDGKQHRPNKEDNHGQASTDMRASRAAARQQFCVLRISYKDTSVKKQLLEQAWRARSPTGWVKVSPQWNEGMGDEYGGSSQNLLRAPYWESASHRAQKTDKEPSRGTPSEDKAG